MNRRRTLEALTRLANHTAGRARAIAQASQFTAEEILEDIAIEARRTLMRQKWGPPQNHAKKHAAPPPAQKNTKKGDTT